MVTLRSYQPLSKRICGTFGSPMRCEIVNVPGRAGLHACDQSVHVAFCE
jgi:hypothetical protein